MLDLDYNNLVMGVEKRLDEIFADDLQIHSPQSAKLKLVKPPSLASLRKIIMSLEWEVTDNHLNDLLKELNRLQRAYIKDDQLQKLLRLLFFLGRYIRVYKSDTHPYVFNSLFRAYNGVIKITSGKYSNHQKTRIVNDEIKRYLSLKAYLKSKNKNISRRTLKRVNTLEKSRPSPIDSSSKQKPYPYKDASKILSTTLNNDFRELKKFIYLEIKKLRQDLQRILALIPKKT
ncbi:MAG: hypothetical protein OET63_12530 [Desulfobacterales bacterium]|jgi:hypothetical protein|nr:hypothetical protein [Desulfobacterales bacterium]HKJ33647.1 hypothetical protein [Balneolales bacterium]